VNVSRILLAVFRMLAALPYSWLRRLGNMAGVVLYHGVRRRTHIARVNLRLCFPQMPEHEREALILAHCKFFARSFLDRFMLWYRPEAYLRKLVQLENVHLIDELEGKPLILLAPHFLGMDAGGTRLSMDRTMFTMFANQKNKVFNEEMRKGRARFSGAMVLSRQDGLRGAIRSAARQLSSLIFLIPAGINLITFYHIAAIPSKLFLLQNERAADTALRPVRGGVHHVAVHIECR